MRVSADFLYEMDRLRKANSKWKLVLIALVAIVVYFTGSGGGKDLKSKYIARIQIDDLLSEDLHTISSLNDLSNDKNVTALVIHINSPGGSPYFSEAIFKSIRRISDASKPVAVVIGTVAASGGYMVALAGDQIFAGETSITGSIGAIMQTIDASAFSEKIGIKIRAFKYPPMKGEPNITEKTSPEVNQALQDVAMDVYDTFLDIVAKRRNLSKENLAVIADGRVYTGKQALKLKLIDRIGDENEALQWLYSEKQISASNKVNDYVIKQDNLDMSKFLLKMPQVLNIVSFNNVTNSLKNLLKLN